jgi:hypothetical protein
LPTRVADPAFREIAALVKRTMPGADVATVPDLPHFAMDPRSAGFVARVLEHLHHTSEPSPGCGAD